jgi:hypothetical protein
MMHFLHPQCRFLPPRPNTFLSTPILLSYSNVINNPRKKTTSPTRHSANIRHTAYGKYQSLPKQYLSRTPYDHHNPKPSQIRTFDDALFYLDHRTMGRSMTTASARGLKWIHSLTEIYIYFAELHKENSAGEGGRK